MSSAEAEALRVMATVREMFKRPVIAWSAGKDSQAMLHLWRRHFPPVPMILFRESIAPEKYTFADTIIREWQLTAHDWPPELVTVRAGNGFLDLVRLHSIGSSPLQVLANLEPPQPGQPYRCTLTDFLLGRPLLKGPVALPWDCILIGAKNSDLDRTLGPLPLAVDVKLNPPGSPAIAFPLRSWTDADVWTYTDCHDVPQDLQRYERLESGWRERADKRFNSDYFTACYRCLDPNEPAEVDCPKHGVRMKNNAALLPKIPVSGVAGYLATSTVEKP